MKKMRVLLGLITRDNGYQCNQASAAQMEARQLGVELDVVWAEGDAIVQSQQLIDAIQSDASRKPHGILFDPVNESGLPQVARAAVAAGIALGVIDLFPPYVVDLRRSPSAVVFSIGSDQTEVGRIQGQQLAKLFSKGGTALLIMGPGTNLTARQRMTGLNQTKPSGFNFRQLRGNWSRESGHAAVKTYLRLDTARARDIDCVVAQSDDMAMGARQAFEQLTDPIEKHAWLSLPFLGCDGDPATGQTWAQEGKLKATVAIPANAPLGLRMLIEALKDKKRPVEYCLTVPQSFPPLKSLAG
jgi:ABC-type sugar transport system substrate-binding protein